MTEEKNINLSINDGEEFFAHEMSIHFNPLQFTFDFKCVTPRNDPRNKQGPTLAIKHNVILIDPFHAKRINELLGRVINDYEKKYGEIEKPKALQKHEEQNKDKMEKDNKTTKQVPSYLG